MSRSKITETQELGQISDLELEGRKLGLKFEPRYVFDQQKQAEELKLIDFSDSLELEGLFLDDHLETIQMANSRLELVNSVLRARIMWSKEVNKEMFRRVSSWDSDLRSHKQSEGVGAFERQSETYQVRTPHGDEVKTILSESAAHGWQSEVLIKKSKLCEALKKNLDLRCENDRLSREQKSISEAREVVPGLQAISASLPDIDFEDSGSSNKTKFSESPDSEAFGAISATPRSKKCRVKENGCGTPPK